MFNGCFKVVSGIFRRTCKGFHEGLKGVEKVFSKVFNASFKVVLRVCQEV